MPRIALLLLILSLWPLMIFAGRREPAPLPRLADPPGASEVQRKPNLPKRVRATDATEWWLDGKRVTYDVFRQANAVVTEVHIDTDGVTLLKMVGATKTKEK